MPNADCFAGVMVMPKIDKEMMQAIEAELAGWKIEWRLKIAKRGHPRVMLRANGQKRFCVTPCTPSDWRGLKNKVSDLRRTLQEMGATKKDNR